MKRTTQSKLSRVYTQWKKIFERLENLKYQKTIFAKKKNPALFAQKIGEKKLSRSVFIIRLKKRIRPLKKQFFFMCVFSIRKHVKIMEFLTDASAKALTPPPLGLAVIQVSFQMFLKRETPEMNGFLKKKTFDVKEKYFSIFKQNIS